jgi:hypothetical protein
MADNDKKSGASHELGNLFVDIGSSGLGSLLKGLNSLSATFLLSKNAAQQFTKPIVDLSKNAGKGIVGLEKINAVTGLTISQLQELQMWSKQNNVDFGSYISQIGNFQQNLLDIAMGKGGNIKGFSLLGLDPRQMDYKKPLEALQMIKKRVQQLDEATGALALKELGLSSDLLYAWKREENQINKKLILNAQEQESLKKQNDAWNRLGVTWEAVTTKLIAQFPVIASWLDKLSNKLERMPDLINNIKNSWDDGSFWGKVVDKFANAINNTKLAGFDKKIESFEEQKSYAIKQGLKTKDPKLKKAYLLKAEEANKQIKALRAQRQEYIPKTTESIATMHARRVGKHNMSANSTQPISDIPPALKSGNNSSGSYDLTGVPQAALSTNSVVNNVTINQDISGDNAIEIASRSSEKIQDSFPTLERQYSFGL